MILVAEKIHLFSEAVNKLKSLPPAVFPCSLCKKSQEIYFCGGTEAMPPYARQIHWKEYLKGVCDVNELLEALKGVSEELAAKQTQVALLEKQARFLLKKRAA